MFSNTVKLFQVQWQNVRCSRQPRDIGLKGEGRGEREYRMFCCMRSYNTQSKHYFELQGALFTIKFVLMFDILFQQKKMQQKA